MICYLISACKSENEIVINNEKLQGSWQIAEAFRDNNKTRLLDNGLFTFLGQKFETNILQDANNYDYIVNDKIIYVEDAPRSRYEVIGFTQDTLILKSNIKGFDFKFVLTKSKGDGED